MTGSIQASSPPRRLWETLGEGGALCHRRSTTVPVGPPRPSIITQPEACSSDCDLQLHCRLAQVDSWLGQFGLAPCHRRYDTTTTIRRLRRPAVGNTWAGWGSMPIIFSPGMAGHPCHTLRATSLSSKENRQISERDDLGPPVVPGGQEIGLGIPKPSPQDGGTSHGARRLGSG
jgi:hypothetical protein